MYAFSSLSTKFLKIRLEMEWMDLCRLKPLWSGMGEVVLARTSPTLHPPFPPTVFILFKFSSASIVMTSTFKSPLYTDCCFSFLDCSLIVHSRISFLAEFSDGSVVKMSVSGT